MTIFYWNPSKRSECEVEVNEGREEVKARQKRQLAAEPHDLGNEI
jgi:hypothetical protein